MDRFPALLFSFTFAVLHLAADAPGVPHPMTVHVDVSSSPELEQWATQAGALIEEWYPKITTVLSVPEESGSEDIDLIFSLELESVAQALGRTITVSSKYIKSKPDDFGLIVHELVHVVQAYPPGGCWWVMEGIADYIRWALYEEKEQDWFPKPDTPKGYLKGYHVSAGFLLWITTEQDPDIIVTLNRHLQQGTYSDDLFQTSTGKTLDELWALYLSDS
jgi:hypothetical protein